MIYLKVFAMFAKIGLFSFGGGLAMLPLIFQEVASKGMMTAAQFSDLVAISQVTPGPVAVNAATFVGFHAGGIGGAAMATLGVTLPSFVIILLVARFLDKYRENRIIQGIFTGIRPVTIGLIAAAVIFLSEAVLVKGPLISKAWLENGLDYLNLIPIGLFIITIILAGKFKLKPIWLMIIMGVSGGLLSLVV